MSPFVATITVIIVAAVVIRAHSHGEEEGYNSQAVAILEKIADPRARKLSTHARAHILALENAASSYQMQVAQLVQPVQPMAIARWSTYLLSFLGTSNREEQQNKNLDECLTHAVEPMGEHCNNRNGYEQAIVAIANCILERHSVPKLNCTSGGGCFPEGNRNITRYDLFQQNAYIFGFSHVVSVCMLHRMQHNEKEMRCCLRVQDLMDDVKAATICSERLNSCQHMVKVAAANTEAVEERMANMIESMQNLTSVNHMNEERNAQCMNCTVTLNYTMVALDMCKAHKNYSLRRDLRDIFVSLQLSTQNIVVNSKLPEWLRNVFMVSYNNLCNERSSWTWTFHDAFDIFIVIAIGLPVTGCHYYQWVIPLITCIMSYMAIIGNAANRRAKATAKKTTSRSSR